ncbi:MAG TPA: penicillin-binding transpeptidase domain-containing protein [Planctomycetota bacterium]|nr:penicillin-binding transpeptidase domain-containing protein [Planctomycetota bacterium]
MLLLVIPTLVLVGQLAWLQLVPSSRELYTQLSQHRSRLLLPPPRGRILARDGTVLAGNRPVYQVHIQYARLDPRDEPLGILLEEMERSGTPFNRSEVESRIIELSDPESIAREPEERDARDAVADGERAPEWLLLLDNISTPAATRLERRLKSHDEVFVVLPRESSPGAEPASGEGSGFHSVWFSPRTAARREITLHRLAALLSRPGSKAPTGAELLEKVETVLDDIEKRIVLEVQRDIESDVSLEHIERKIQTIRRVYRREHSWLLLPAASIEVVTRIEYHSQYYAGLLCLDSVERQYPLAEACGTLTGHLRQLDKEEVKKLHASGRLIDAFSWDEPIEEFALARKGAFRRSDWVGGGGGLEEFHDDTLRGLHGLSNLSVDKWNRPLEILEEVPVVAGGDVTTTLDANLQKKLYGLLESAVKSFTGADSLGGKPVGGSAVVMEIPSGALLASVSFPGYDPSRRREVGYEEKMTETWGKGWLLDRPSRQAISPGSVFKIAMTAAAMESARPWQGDFTPLRTYPCHYIFVPIPDLHCNSTQGHNEVNLVEALQLSCNIYFYYLGLEHLGADLICPWAYNLGYGRWTGIDLPRSRAFEAGKLYAPNEVETFRQTCHYSIGQECVVATPLQVLRSVAAIAAGGKLLPRPYLSRPSTPEEIHFENPHTIEVIREGLWRAGHQPSGTAGNPKLGLSSFNAAYKTGTAEVEVGKKMIMHNAWLVGFAPFENPTIAFSVVIEKVARLHGGEVCAPIVREILTHFSENDPAFRLPDGRTDRVEKVAAPHAAESVRVTDPPNSDGSAN